MRIAYICADAGVPVFGCKGCSIHVQEVIRAFRKQGHEVVLFAANLGGEAPLDLAISVHQLPLASGNRATKETASLAANVDLRLALASSEFDLVYERYSLWSFAGMEYARDVKIPGILEVNAPLIAEQQKYRGLVNLEAAQQVAARVFSAASSLIAVSEGVAAYLATFPATRGKIYVIPNGVNCDRFTPIPSIANKDNFTVGFVGTMKPWHGLPTLISAFTILHRADTNARLLIVGDGPEREQVTTALAARGLQHAATITGAVTPAVVPELLAAMDVAVAPYPKQSHYFSPLKVYEYMAAGLPVVASEVGQLTDIIQDRENGLLCVPENPLHLAALLYQLRLQPKLRLRLGAAARQTALHHTWDVVVQRILNTVVVEVSY